MIDCGNEPYIATDPEILDLLVSNYCRYKAEAILGIEIKDLSYYRRSNSINLTFQHKNLVISVDLITESNLNSRG